LRQVERDTLWERIQERLQREPERVKYNENDREWMEKTVRFYESRRWDYTVCNDEENGVPTLMDKLLRLLSAELLDFVDMDDVRSELGIESPPRPQQSPNSRSFKAIPMAAF
jgi:hypothetical protein